MRCRLCRGTTDLILGDGPIVCAPCVWMMGRIAREPETATDRMLAALDELHADVLTLIRKDDVLAWRWTADWPKAAA